MSDATAAAKTMTESMVDKAHPGIDARQRTLLMIAYAASHATRFAARDGHGSEMAVAYGDLAGSLARDIASDINDRVTAALAQD
jgi:hypothetical protein